MDTVYYGVAGMIIFILSGFMFTYFEEVRSKGKQIMTKVRKFRIRTPFHNENFRTKEKETTNHTNTNITGL